MWRWMSIAIVVAACDKGPIQEHHIHYLKGGLGSHGPLTYRIDVDLDKRMLMASDPTAPQDPPDPKPQKTLIRALTEQEAKDLAILASAARDEADGPRAQVSDSYEKITLDGDKQRVIENSGPMTAPIAAKLEGRLELLAGWR